MPRAISSRIRKMIISIARFPLLSACHTNRRYLAGDCSQAVQIKEAAHFRRLLKRQPESTLRQTLGLFLLKWNLREATGKWHVGALVIAHQGAAQRCGVLQKCG